MTPDRTLTDDGARDPIEGFAAFSSRRVAPSLYFDTSAINWVHDNDPDLPRDLRSCEKATQISVYNVLELAGTEDPERRCSLLRTALALCQEYRPLVEAREVLALTLRAFLNGNSKIEVSVPSDHPFWNFLLRPQGVGQSQRLIAIEEKRRFETEFRSAVRSLRKDPEISKDLCKIRLNFTSPNAFVQACLEDRNLLRQFFNLDALFDELGCPEVRGRGEEIVSRVTNWRAYIAAHLYATYEQVLQEQNFGSKKTAGCLDLLQLTYLPASEFFVTQDIDQLRVARHAALRCFRTEAIAPWELRRVLLN